MVMAPFLTYSPHVYNILFSNENFINLWPDFQAPQKNSNKIFEEFIIMISEEINFIGGHEATNFTSTLIKLVPNTFSINYKFEEEILLVKVKKLMSILIPHSLSIMFDFEVKGIFQYAIMMNHFFFKFIYFSIDLLVIFNTFTRLHTKY